MVCVDEPRRDDRAAEGLARVGIGLLACADLGNEAVVDQDPAVGMLRPGIVAGDDAALGVERLHAGASDVMIATWTFIASGALE
jgi:hypothetical protein